MLTVDQPHTLFTALSMYGTRINNTGAQWELWFSFLAQSFSSNCCSETHQVPPEFKTRHRIRSTPTLETEISQKTILSHLAETYRPDLVEAGPSEISRARRGSSSESFEGRGEGGYLFVGGQIAT